MHARLQRLHRRTLPNVSGPMLAGVMAVLAVLGFGSALPSLSGAMLDRRGTFPNTGAPAAPKARVAPRHARAAAPALPAAPASDPSDGTENEAPRIGNVRFRPAVATVGQDLRLQVEAFDPEGDPVVLRTEWTVDGQEIETPEPVLPRSRFTRGSSIRARVRAGDGRHESTPFATHEIAVSNAPPVITTFPGGFDETGAFVYPLAAVDPDGDDHLRFRLLEGPPGMRLGADDAVLRWQPRADQVGRHAVRLEVSDGHGGASLQSFDLVARARGTGRARLAELAPRPAP